MSELPTRSKTVEVPQSEEVQDLALDEDVRTALIEISYGRRLMYNTRDVNAMVRGLASRGIGFRRMPPVSRHQDDATFPGTPLM